MSRPIRVLVLDDEEPIRTSLVDYLEDEGFKVLAAESSEDALDVLRQQDIDVAVVDIRLPGMNGNDFILEAHRRRPDVRFLIHTGSVNYTLPESLEALGIADEHVFRKPTQDVGVIGAAIRRLSSKESSP